MLDKLLLIFTIIANFVPLIAVFILTPQLSRNHSLFGVTLPSDAQRNAKIKQIVLFFRVFVLVAGLSLMGTAYGGGTVFLVGVCVGAYVALCLGVYGYCNHLLRGMVIEEGLLDLQKPVYLKQIPPSYLAKPLSIWWYVCLLLPIATGVYLAAWFPSPYGVGIPVLQAAFALMALVCRLWVVRAKQHAEHDRVEQSISQNHRFRRRWSILTLACSFGMEALLLLPALEMAGLVGEGLLTKCAPFAGTLLACGAAIVMVLRFNRNS